MSLSNTFLIDMTAAADALGGHTATYAATATMAVPGLAIGFAAATAFAQDRRRRRPPRPRASSRSGYIISGHSLELSIDFPYGPRRCRSTSRSQPCRAMAAAISFRGMRCPTWAACRCTACSEARQRLRPKGIYPMNL